MRDQIVSSTIMNPEIAMNTTDITLVQSTWEQIVPTAGAAMQLFYAKLFELDPSLRPLFAKAEMAEHYKKVEQIITAVVRNLERVDELLPAIEALGRRHVGYGMKEQYYSTAATALLWTLEQGLGPAFTPEVRLAWTETYTILAAVMQRGARELAA
jgi:hemoglobin-like flavoprotein